MMSAASASDADDYDQLFLSVNSEKSDTSENATTPKISNCSHHHHRHHNENREIDEDENEDNESLHFNKIVEAFLFYRRHSELKLSSKIKAAQALPESQLELKSRLRQHYRQIYRCATINYNFLKLVVAATGQIFENRDQIIDIDNPDHQNRYYHAASDFNMEKLQSTLRQIVRDWTREGEQERQQSYQPILDQLSKIWPSEIIDRSKIRILVPGAGLGRLAFEVAKLGFECQGNEFSLFMLFVSNFILNRCQSIDEFTIYPYVHQWTNNWNYDDQLKSIRFPDTVPADILSSENFSMTAGDFLGVYDESEKEKWDAVATVFFIDTTRNVIDYLETIYRLLKRNGYWLNFGPLLYHFADLENEISLELPYEEILNTAKKMGFEILIDEKRVPATYTQNRLSMLQYQYSCAYTVFRKVAK